MKLLKQSGAMYLVEFLIVAAAVIGAIAVVTTSFEGKLHTELTNLSNAFMKSFYSIDTTIGAKN